MEKTVNKGKIWSKYFVVAILVEMFTQMVINFLNTALNVYGDAISGSANYVGLLTTFFTLGAILMAPFVGVFSDRYGRQKVIITGVLLFLVPSVVFMFSTSTWLGLVLRFFQGLGKSMFQIGAAAMVADVTPKSRAGEALGYYSLGMMMALAIGPTVGMLLSDTGNYTLMFGFTAAVLLLALIMGILANYEKKGIYEIQRDSAPEGGFLRSLVEVQALPAGLVRFFTSCSSTCVWAFIGLHGSKVLGFDAFRTGLFFVACAAGMLLARAFAGRLIDRRGAVAAIIPALLLSLIPYVILAFFCEGNFVLYMFSGLCFGVSEGVSQPGIRAVAVVDSPENRRGAANSVINFGLDGGIAIAAWLFGMVINADSSATQVRGYQNMYVLCIGFTLISLGLTLILLNNKARARRREKAGVVIR